MLFLGGGGDEKKSKLLDTTFSTSLPQNPKLLYIPVAINSKEYKKCFEWINHVFSEISYNRYRNVDRFG